MIGDGVPRLSVASVTDDEVSARVVSPARCRRARASTSRSRGPSCRDHREGRRRPRGRLRGGRRLRRALVRALGGRHRAAARAHARARLPRPRDREDREGRGLRRPRRDHRGLRRRDGRPRRLRRRGRRRARAADAEGHDPARHAAGQDGDHRHADARVDDPVGRAHARRGGRRRQRGDRRHVGGDALGRDERRPLPVEAVRAMATIAEAAEEAPEIHGRARDIVQDTPAAAIMHAAVELADEIDAAAIVIPTRRAATPRACAKYRPRRPLIVLAHQPGVAEQLALEWGVYATRMDARRHRRRADRLRARRRARLRRAAPGAKVVITAGPRRDRRRHEPDHDPGGARARSANPTS